MRGLAIGLPAKYENVTLENLARLSTRFGFREPVEIWEAGNEVSPDARHRLEGLGNVTIRNVAEISADVEDWKGFQIKGFICRHSKFDELILADADVIFFQSPETIWKDRGYRATGTYFFRDRAQWKFHDLRSSDDDKFQSEEFFEARRKWILDLMPEKSRFFPPEWDYIYGKGLPRRPVAEAYMEAGVVYLDRARCGAAIDNIFQLNRDHEVTYRHVWGDKETYWIACCKAGLPFTMNRRYPRMKRQLTQYYGMRPFYTQNKG